MKPFVRATLPQCFAVVLAVQPLAGAMAAAVKAPPAPTKSKDTDLDVLTELEADKTAADLNGLRFSHLSLIESWTNVEPYAVRQKVAGADYRWKMGLGF